MYRQSPNRNQRSKGIKLKNVLQICLLLAVCFWLLYQVKHSHDKKKEFDETDDTKASLERTSMDEPMRLGRKDIKPRVDETDSKNEIRDETSDDEETTEEVELNKHGEDDLEDKKIEETEDEEAGGRDDEREEHEQEKSDAEIDGEQDLVNGEQREDGEENGTQETDSEDGHDQMEKDRTVDDTDHDANDRTAHEAREEHYKADDASSAVTHDTHIVTENENEHVKNPNEHPENVLEEEMKENNTEETYEGESRKDLEVDGSEAARDGHQSNVTATAIMDDMLHESENARTEGSTDHLMSNSTTAEITLENNELPSHDAIESKPELGHGQGNLTEGTSTEGSYLKTIDSKQDNNFIINAESTHSDSNSTGSAETKESPDFSESSNSTDSSESDNIRLEAWNEEGNSTESSSENKNDFDGERSDISDGTDERLETTVTDNPEEVQEDAIDISDTSNSMEEKDIRVDLDTLPEIQTEGTNSEDVAAE